MDQVYDAFVANQKRMMSTHELLGRTTLEKPGFEEALRDLDLLGVLCFWGDMMLRGPKFMHIDP